MWIRGYPPGAVVASRALRDGSCSTIRLSAARRVLSLASKTSVLLFLKVGFFSASLALLSACDSVQGYPQDPDNSTAIIASFDPNWDTDYSLSPNPEARRRYRDLIVLNRMRAYDIEFDNFERGLYGQGNSLAVAGSLATITMGAVGGVAGGAVTKAALNSASAAVTGAEGAISKELYYQRTLPALIAQMEANRTNAKLGILAGIKQPDSAYPLVQAYADLESLKAAGGVPMAISNVTQIASANAQDANDALQVVSRETFRTSVSASGTTLDNWLAKDVRANTAQLRSWMNGHGLKGKQLQEFLNQPAYEAQREQAIKFLVK
jgi:hypothetical protein